MPKQNTRAACMHGLGQAVYILLSLSSQATTGVAATGAFLPRDALQHQSGSSILTSARATVCWCHAEGQMICV